MCDMVCGVTSGVWHVEQHVVLGMWCVAFGVACGVWCTEK